MVMTGRSLTSYIETTWERVSVVPDELIYGLKAQLVASEAFMAYMKIWNALLNK